MPVIVLGPLQGGKGSVFHVRSSNGLRDVTPHNFKIVKPVERYAVFRFSKRPVLNGGPFRPVDGFFKLAKASVSGPRRFVLVRHHNGLVARVKVV